VSTEELERLYREAFCFVDPDGIILEMMQPL